MRNNLRHRWPRGFEEPKERHQLALFQRMEMSPSSLGKAEFLLFGGWEEGNIFNILIKHVSFSYCCFKLEAHGSPPGTKWPVLLLVGSHHMSGSETHESQNRGGRGVSHDKQNIYNQVWR